MSAANGEYPPLSGSARREICDLIAFYTVRGWDWLRPVQYICAKALGDWPPRVIRTRIGSGRPRRQNEKVEATK